eukprot:3778421-Pleurochrysis_carterae.AAC.1
MASGFKTASVSARCAEDERVMKRRVCSALGAQKAAKEETAVAARRPAAKSHDCARSDTCVSSNMHGDMRLYVCVIPTYMWVSIHM